MDPEQQPTHLTAPGSIAETSPVNTGIPEIDHHHRLLIDILRRAREHVDSGRDSAEFEEIIADLMAYSIYHFDTEETLMGMYGYAQARPEDAARHIDEHRVFAGTIVAFRNDLKSGAALDLHAVLDFVTSWLNEHIRRVDMLLARFILDSERP